MFMTIEEKQFPWDNIRIDFRLFVKALSLSVRIYAHNTM